MPSFKLSKPKWSIIVERLRSRNNDPLADLIEKKVTFSTEENPKVKMDRKSGEFLVRFMKTVNKQLDGAKDFYEKNEGRLLEPSDPVGREGNANKRK